MQLSQPRNRVRYNSVFSTSVLKLRTIKELFDNGPDDNEIKLCYAYSCIRAKGVARFLESIDKKHMNFHP
jgi:hypothetical protein